ncbi:MAG: CDP-alcohol phosphatidyltransferase family protein [Candidatus Helarchaeota archaeon]
MVSQFRIRRIFRPLVQWVAQQFAKLQVTPTQVSVLGTVLALLGCVCFIFLTNYWDSFLFALLIFGAGLLDGVDGALARLTNTVTLQGGYLDSILDRYADSCIVLSFLVHYPQPTSILNFPIVFWVFFTLIGVFLVSYIRTKAETSIVPNCDVGLAGRSERLLLLIIFSLLDFIHFSFAYVGLILVGILAHITAIHRIIFVYHSNRLPKKD